MTDINLISLLLFTGSALLAGGIVTSAIFKRKSPSYTLKGDFSKESQLLFNALVDCHLKNNQEYLSNIKKLAGFYPDEPVFFLLAGDIARKTDPEKALEIHRDVLFRPTTTGKFRSLVLKHIADDYIALKQNSKALSVLKDAVKNSHFPQARLAISKILESDGNLEEAYTELEKYVTGSDIRERTLLKRFAARAVHFNFKNGSVNKAVHWLEITGKLTEDNNEIKAVDYTVALIKGKQKKAAAYLKALAETSEQHELLGRSLLLKTVDGDKINSLSEGKFSQTFDLFFHPETENRDAAAAAGEKSVFFGKLLSNSAKDGSCGDFLKNTMKENLFFVCSECRKDIKVISPVCPVCQKITGRNFKILSED